jgi:hypothetical protein
MVLDLTPFAWPFSRGLDQSIPVLGYMTLAPPLRLTLVNSPMNHHHGLVHSINRWCNLSAPLVRAIVMQFRIANA